MQHISNAELMNNLNAYLPLCILKVNPLDLPESKRFLKQNLLCYLLVWLFIQANMIDPVEALVEVITETALTFAFIAIILSLNKTMHLYVQITTAVLFCENIVAVVSVPVMVWLTASNNIVSYLLLATLIIWCVVMITFVIKKVVAISFIAGLAISLFYFFSTYVGAYGFILLLF